MKAKIIDVADSSLAQKNNIKKGDILTELNSMTDFDILDYMYAEANEHVSLKTLNENGETFTHEIDNPDYLSLGISFENFTINEPKQCLNNCIFCFMAQMPKGLRDTLYFKDDDYRLSFLAGNYITLTNVTFEDLKRIAEMKVDSLNISVHTTNPYLRVKMMRNKTAGDIMDKLNYLKDNNVKFNLQFVLCPGINDSIELRRSLDDVLSLAENITSLSVVPVGLSAYREGLYPLRSYSSQEAKNVLDIIDEYRIKVQKINPDASFCASDEFFILAGRDFPKAEYYGDFLQYENGVGMSVSFTDEIEQLLLNAPCVDLKGFSAVLVTGVLGEKVINEPIKHINAIFGCNLKIFAVKNEFFGESVTASGLVCGCDIIKQLKGCSNPVVIPSNMLKDDEDIFLDGISVEQLKKELNVPCYIVTPNIAGLEELLRSIN